jgi:hypothetical protein
LPVVLSLTSGEEHRLTAFDKRVFRRIFGPKRNEVTRRWIKLYNLYSSSNIIRMIKSRERCDEKSM